MRPVVWIILLLIVIAGAGAGFYYFYEKPIEEEPVYTLVDINIQAINIERELVVTGYSLSPSRAYNNNSEDKTMKNGMVLRKFNSNSTIFVHNINLEDQDYYTDLERYEIQPRTSFNYRSIDPE